MLDDEAAAPWCGIDLMARIRSIKPEFPQSETIGDASRLKVAL
jgi:hypothetical protein